MARSIRGNRFTSTGTLPATGTVLANAALVVNDVTVVTGADDAKGVVLPTPLPGQLAILYSNQAVNGLKVYPSAGGTINDGTPNAAVVMEGKSLGIFVGTNSTNWAANFTANT